MEVYDAEQWAIRLALRESVKTRNALQTNGVMKVPVVRDSQAAIRRTEHPEPGPGQHPASQVNQCTWNLREGGIEKEIHSVRRHTGIPGSAEADHQANILNVDRRARTVLEQVNASVANRTRRIAEANTAAKAEWEAKSVQWVWVTHRAPGLDQKKGSVQFQTQPKTRLAASWWANPAPVPVDLQDLLGLARPVGYNLQF